MNQRITSVAIPCVIVGTAKSLAEEARWGRRRQVIRQLADSLDEDKLRRQFLASEAIRRALI